MNSITANSLTLVLLYITAVTAYASRFQDDTLLRVMTYNVRYDSMPDNITVQQTLDSMSRALPSDPAKYYPMHTERPWSTRRINIANDILTSGAHVYGGQELLRRQVDDLQELLGDTWSWIGVGRDDGRSEGEYSPIFYQNNILYLYNYDTFWLTNTPFEVSKYSDAGSKRICTTAHFSILTHSHRNINLTILNTHLDDQSAAQRHLGASLLLHRAKYEALNTKHPVILTGDFNSPPNDTAYRAITAQTPPTELNKTFTDRYNWSPNQEKNHESFILDDTLSITPPHRRSGHHATFTDFVDIMDTTQYERLDYIFAGRSEDLSAVSYHVGSNVYDDGVYASDHRPVYADLRFRHHGSATIGSEEMEIGQSQVLVHRLMPSM